MTHPNEEASAGIGVTVADKVMVITIDRPGVRNALDRRAADEIARAMDLLDESPDCRVGLLTGSGGTFSAGMDLKEFARSGERPLHARRGGGGLVWEPPAKPLIAAVEGLALGLGFEMVLACDLIVAAENASFGLPEVTRGLVAGGGGALRLPRRLPHHIAMEILLTGRRLPAREAASLGLVNVLAPPGEALLAASTMATTIVANAPLAVEATKRLVYRSATWPIEKAFGLQEEILQPVLESSDAHEGAAAFAARRAPVWQGR